MFTDIVGSTTVHDVLVSMHGESAGDAKYRNEFSTPHNDTIRNLLEAHRGFEVKTIGDAFMVAFASAEDGVRCASAIQQALRDRPIRVDGSEPLTVRIGLHTGAPDLVERKGRKDYEGHAVNIASRVEGLLKGGRRIYCSRATANLATPTPSFTYHNHGFFALKGIASPVEIVEVVWDPSNEPLAPHVRDLALPYPWLTPWVGREQKMAEVAEALHKTKLVTIHGPGGVGKTRLAVETLLTRGIGLPREPLFVSLEGAAVSGNSLLGLVRDAIELTENDAPDVKMLTRRLRGGDRLLILDNFETVIASGVMAGELAATPGVRVLITSQQTLDVPGERVIELETMATEGELESLESYRLFRGLAQQRDPNWKPDDDAAMRDVLEATDGMPYLIEIVAAAAHRRTLRDLADELRTHLHEIKRRGAGNVRRHDSVEGCLEWAFGRLPTHDRAAISRLSVFPGSFDAESALGIADTPVSTLDVLVDASLLRFDRSSGRYSMLATTRQYARQRRSLDDIQKSAGRHATWFIQRLDAADDALHAKGADAQAQARRWIAADLENIDVAIAWAEGHNSALFGRGVEACRLYSDQTSRFSQQIRLEEVYLSHLDPRSSRWALSQGAIGVCYAQLSRGGRSDNLSRAIASFGAALSAVTEESLPTHWAAMQMNLGAAYESLPAGNRSRNIAKAIRHRKLALKVYTESAFPRQWAKIQSSLGMTYLLERSGEQNILKAIACCRAALRVQAEGDYPLDWASTQMHLGIAYLSLLNGERVQNLLQAITFFENALRVWTARDFPLEWARVQNNLGITYAKLSKDTKEVNLSKAISCFESVLTVYTEPDNPLERAQAHANLGLAYDRAGGKANREIAVGHFESAARSFDACGLTTEAAKFRAMMRKRK